MKFGRQRRRPAAAIPLLLALAALQSLAGCRGGASRAAERDPIPAVTWTNEQDALRILAERGRAVKAVEAEASVTITQPKGQTVRLDGAVVIAPPDRARLRAWKLGQAVFDLTLTPDGLWVFMGREPGSTEKRPEFPKDTTRLARQWLMLMTAFFEQEGLVVDDRFYQTLDVRKTLDDGSVVTCVVDRLTLTPRRYTVKDRGGGERFKLTLREYRQVDGINWPTVLSASSEQVGMVIEMRAPELNGRIAPKTFTPPRRAEKLP